MSASGRFHGDGAGVLVSVWLYEDGSWIVAGSEKDEKGRVGVPVFQFAKGQMVEGWATRAYDHLARWLGGAIRIVDQSPDEYELFSNQGLVVSITPDFYSYERLLDVVVRVGPGLREELRALLDKRGNIVDMTEPRDVTGLAQSLGYLDRAFELWSRFIRKARSARKEGP